MNEELYIYYYDTQKHRHSALKRLQRTMYRQTPCGVSLHVYLCFSLHFYFAHKQSIVFGLLLHFHEKYNIHFHIIDIVSIRMKKQNRSFRVLKMHCTNRHTYSMCTFNQSVEFKFHFFMAKYIYNISNRQFRIDSTYFYML